MRFTVFLNCITRIVCEFLASTEWSLIAWIAVNGTKGGAFRILQRDWHSALDGETTIGTGCDLRRSDDQTSTRIVDDATGWSMANEAKSYYAIQRMY